VFKAATGAGADPRDEADAADKFESTLANDTGYDSWSAALLVAVSHFGEALLFLEDATKGDGSSIPSAQASASSAAETVASAYAAFTAACG
jgi:hypothetical protein